MEVACLDLEGVLVPEIWINVAQKTKIDDLKLTTRDISDYDILMKKRIQILKEHKLKIQDIQNVISKMTPFEGAREFLLWLKECFQVIILSDTFYEFASTLMRQLDYPTLFCNRLVINGDGYITNYRLRQPEQKRESVKALHALNFRVIAAGDSYNDTKMLKEADVGVLFRPPENIIKEFSEFPVAFTFEELKNAFITNSIYSKS